MGAVVRVDGGGIDYLTLSTGDVYERKKKNGTPAVLYQLSSECR